MKNWKIGLIALIAVLGCRNSDEPNFELVQDMFISPAVKAQDEDADSGDLRAMRMPPEGTVPRGFKTFNLDFETANSNLKNPLDDSPENITRGQKVFYTYCFVCHGALGKGDGPIKEKFPLPIPSLMSNQARSYKDGGIFQIITKGRGLMGSYAGQIPSEEDRWALIKYIRHLQSTSEVFPKEN